MKILAIESSCDETAVAVTKERRVISSVIASQVDEHVLYGGVVPEIASRRHTENISAVVQKALEDAGCTLADIDAVAVTYAPGLIGALLVGVNFAKGLCLSGGLPLVPVHHLRGHIAANYITDHNLKPPFLCLVVSGGHSHLVEVRDYTDFSVIGRTLDDAAGECFDKTARAMGLPYPGGVHLDRIADETKAGKYRLPHPSVSTSRWDMSFSGLKTAVINTVHNAEQKNETIDVPALAGAVRKSVCDILVDRTMLAAEEFGYKKIAIAGGVSANSELRRRLSDACKAKGAEFYCPDLSLCGDNAAMIGVQGFYEYSAGNIADMSLNAAATMDIACLK